MRHLHALACALVTLFGALYARADSTPLLLEEVTRAALARHPLLAAAEKETVIASADLRSAEGGFDPSLRARGFATPWGPYRYEHVDVVAEQPTAVWGTKLFAGWR